ncbi:hypothetical protein HZ320_01045 [[Pasteurella] aerogenes]|nr:hypothetical protein HZ320_01045 [[Pasteurella] aerogenes]
MNALKCLIENRKTIGIALIVAIVGISGNLDYRDQITIEKARCEKLGGKGVETHFFLENSFECVFKDGYE